MLQQLTDQHFEAFRRNKPVLLTHGHQHFLRSFNGAGGAQRHGPALNTELPGQGFQFLYRRQASTLEIFFIDCPAREVGLREAHAAHATAFHQAGLKIFTDDQLGRTAADINHQLTTALRLRMLNAHKNQARFFIAGDDLDRVGDHFFRAFKKLRRVGRLTQRMRPDDADAGRGEPLQTFSKQRQAVQPAGHRFFAQHRVFIKAIGQMHALFQASNDLHGAIDDTGDHHMKTVRTKVDRSEFLRPRGYFVYWHRLVGLFE